MKNKTILFGAAYYDEYMPYDRIHTDMKMMKEAGMNVIRIAESTWSTLEPQEGIFDFAHLDRMLDVSEQYDINVILGTPSYAVPTWLVKKYPDILAVTHEGEGIYGRRQNMDITHPIYLKYVEHIIRTLLEHIQDRTNIIGFQLDNETKSYDTCGPRVQKMFVELLKKQYPDIAVFNHEFGLDYWSNRINCWEDFPDIRGTINASLGAEFERFQRSLVTDFLTWQADIVREYSGVAQFITQNFDFDWRGYSYGMQPLVNQFEAAKCMTVAGVDIYHPSQDDLTGAEVAFGGSIGRSLKHSNYLVLETQAQGNSSWLPFEGQLRQLAYSHISSCSNSVMYWHWHSIHNSFETYWKGLLSHDFSANATYQEAKQIGKEFEQIGNRIINLDKQCKVAFMLNNESLTGLKWFPISRNLEYNDIVRWLYDAFYWINIECDIIPSDYDNLSQYSLIVIPALYSASEDILRKIDSYVKRGGHLLTTFKTGFCDEHLKVYSDTQPHILSKCCGLEYNQFTIPKNVTLKQDTVKIDVSDWMELLIPTTANVWSYYNHQHWSKYAAITHNKYGQGTATYIGCYFCGTYLENVIERLWKELNFNLPKYRFPIICKEGINDFGHKIQFYFNYSDKEYWIPYHNANGLLLLENKPVYSEDILLLNAWDIKIIEIMN